MHFTGTIWRPPYEAESLLLEVTAGCSWHRCKFCTLYNDLPFPFRMSPLEDIKADLTEAQMLANTPFGKLGEQLLGRPVQIWRRAYLTGGNPFILRCERLLDIARLLRTYFPQCTTIGTFARVTDISAKSDKELQQLKEAGYDGLTIGVETGDAAALTFMDKGYGPEEILAQCRRLDKVGISYYFMYLTGISGAGKGVDGAAVSAELFNRLHPKMIGTSMLTIFPDSKLYREMQAGNWVEPGEQEKLREVRTLVDKLTIPTAFAALGASNAVSFYGKLPLEKERLLFELDRAIQLYSEEDLQAYRHQLPHL